MTRTSFASRALFLAHHAVEHPRKKDDEWPETVTVNNLPAADVFFSPMKERAMRRPVRFSAPARNVLPGWWRI